jgi:hypothetical protein
MTPIFINKQVFLEFAPFFIADVGISTWMRSTPPSSNAIPRTYAASRPDRIPSLAAAIVPFVANRATLRRRRDEN